MAIYILYYSSIFPLQIFKNFGTFHNIFEKGPLSKLEENTMKVKERVIQRFPNKKHKAHFLIQPTILFS